MPTDEREEDDAERELDAEDEAAAALDPVEVTELEPVVEAETEAVSHYVSMGRSSRI